MKVVNVMAIKVGNQTLRSAILCPLPAIGIVITPVYAQEQIYDKYVDPDGLITIEYPSDWELIGQSADDFVAYLSFNFLF
jgi:hypothetical protein